MAQNAMPVFFCPFPIVKFVSTIIQSAHQGLRLPSEGYEKLRPDTRAASFTANEPGSLAHSHSRVYCQIYYCFTYEFRVAFPYYN